LAGAVLAGAVLAGAVLAGAVFARAVLACAVVAGAGLARVGLVGLAEEVWRGPAGAGGLVAVMADILVTPISLCAIVRLRSFGYELTVRL
jgi:hypothetical protein